jgi:N4-gp56 family major capsid protein
MEATDQAYYDRKLLERAQPLLVHAKFGQSRPLKTKSTKNVIFRRWEKLTPTTTALVESITPLGTSLSKTDIMATLAQYGDFVTGSDMLEFTSRDEVLNEAADVLGEQGGESIDQVCRDVVVAGSAVACAEDSVGAIGTTRTNVDGLINAIMMDKVIRALQIALAKPFTKLIKPGQAEGTTAILPSYWCITHPEVYYTLRGVTGFVSVKDYPSQQEVMEGEVGSYKDIRFVSTTFCKIFLGGGNTTTSGHKGTSSQEDVYAQPVFGRNAYAVVELSGHAMEMITKQKGSAGTADPLDQRWTVGWKAIQTFKILNDAFMYRMETGAAS